MSIVSAGEGRKLVTKAQEVTFKATAGDGSSISIFEVVVPPGFDVGAHVHTESQEFFYVLEGELELLCFEPTERTTDTWHHWESASGDRVVRVGAGSCMFVPPNTPHAFRNPTDKPTTMLFQSYPSPEHEHYFEEITEIWSTGRTVDPAAVEEMRKHYDVTQITPMRFEPPVLRDPQPAAQSEA
ncbi:cupin domain-containing protein [Streptomyces xanthophaeus]|uniref:Cupin n=1 Tax=Streptomyces xanthophaeus TaxID=67385 RepID=A0A919LEN8_9ACTN|nr:cupin domain-containing protein [Streptomyces xanthophaeus]GHI84872.1 cupin [Streptomyces xanthophaeus]GHI90344.1 cupin [Streptomyces xanthophaeus]GHI90510.1 cupin [Streptomyces xanthophaeus]